MRVVKYELTVNKLVTGERKVYGWAYYTEDAIYGFVSQIFTQNEKKLRKQLFASFGSFKAFPRTGTLPNVVRTGDEIEITDGDKEDEEELTPEDIAKKRDAGFRRAVSRAKENLLKGWYIDESKNFVALSQAGKRYTKDLLNHAEALRGWLDKNMEYIGSGIPGRTMIRIFADDDQESAYNKSRGWSSDFPEIVTHEDKQGWSDWAMEKLNRGVLRQWLKDKNDRLRWAAPAWIDHGLFDFFEGARSKGKKVTFKEDDWESERMRELRRADKLLRAREFFSITSEEMWTSQENWSQPLFFVKFLLAGSGAKGKYKNVFSDYVKNMIFVLQEEADKEADAKKNEKKEKKKPQTEEEEDALYRERQQAWRKRERGFLDKLLERTFGRHARADRIACRGRPPAAQGRPRLHGHRHEEGGGPPPGRLQERHGEGAALQGGRLRDRGRPRLRAAHPRGEGEARAGARALPRQVGQARGPRREAQEGAGGTLGGARGAPQAPAVAQPLQVQYQELRVRVDAHAAAERVLLRPHGDVLQGVLEVLEDPGAEGVGQAQGLLLPRPQRLQPQQRRGRRDARLLPLRAAARAALLLRPQAPREHHVDHVPRGEPLPHRPHGRALPVLPLDETKKKLTVGGVQHGRLTEIWRDMDAGKNFALADLIADESRDYRHYYWGWSFVHFMLETPKYEKKFKKYFAALARGKDVRRAPGSFNFKSCKGDEYTRLFMKIVGVNDLDALQEEWYAHIKSLDASELRGLEEAGRSAYQQGRKLRAHRLLGDAIEKGSTDVQVYIYYANVLVWADKGTPEDSLKVLEKACEVDSLDADAWAYRGFALIRLDRKDEGRKYIELAKEINPEDDFFNLEVALKLAEVAEEGAGEGKDKSGE
jgi:tetratricopeptide (TPR) repeat protein